VSANQIEKSVMENTRDPEKHSETAEQLWNECNLLITCYILYYTLQN